MNELGPMGFENSVGRYVDSLEQFRNTHDLKAKSFFAHPDHLAVKCYDAEHFEDTLAGWLPAARHASYVWLNGRRLASVQLKDGLPLGDLGYVGWLELMEPRPERVGKDVVGVEHTEFFVPNLELTRTRLERRGIEFEPQSNEHHAWLNVVINQHGQEVKFTNNTLAQMTRLSVRNGEAEVLV